MTGLPTAESNAAFQQVTEDPNGTHIVNFKIEEHDEDIQTIQMRCLDSRTYLRCTLTEAGGDTFVDMETGTDEGDEQADTDDQTKAFFIRLAGKMVDGLRRTA